MKKILFIMIALLTVSSIYAQTFNPVTSSLQVTASTKIITPLSIDAINTAPRDFGNLIQGQTRTFNPTNPIALFDINREVNQGLWLKVFEPTVNDGKSGVTLVTKWYHYTGNWTDGSGAVDFQPGTDLQWLTDGGSVCHVAMVVQTATASATAELGQHQFNVNIQAQYYSF